MAGLRLIDMISDLIPVSRPRHPASYSVARPIGAFTARPARQPQPRSAVKNVLGITAQSPPFPPSPLPGAANTPVEPVFSNLNDGFTTWTATVACFCPRGSTFMPAGLNQTTLASSAAAAPPANAL